MHINVVSDVPQEKYGGGRGIVRVGVVPHNEDQWPRRRPSDKYRSYTVLDLLRGRVLRRNTIIITFIW
jgi:hypothetical protein